MAKQISTQRPTAKKVDWQYPLHKKNFMLILAGVATIVVGYLLMATGITSDPQQYQTTWNSTLSTSIAPVVLVIGYCVIIPYAIIKFFPSNDDNNQ